MDFIAAIFDLDGVLVDTAKYHYFAWKRLADELGFVFTQEDNERLKGVSRQRSLDILLEIGKLEFSEEEKELLASRKNTWYVECLMRMGEGETLPGAKELLAQYKNSGIKIALGSASKNAGLILDRLKIRDCFDAIVDGNIVSKAKPDPEVFLTAAKLLNVDPQKCIVFEDAKAGIEAAKAAGMRAIGVGDREKLPNADAWINSLCQWK